MRQWGIAYHVQWLHKTNKSQNNPYIIWSVLNACLKTRFSSST